MEKVVFARLLEIQAIIVFMVTLLSCSPIASKETSSPTTLTLSLTPAPRVSSSQAPTNVSPTGTITRGESAQEIPEIVSSTPTESPPQKPTTVTSDINLKDHISSDLIFVSNGALVLWDSEDGVIKPIVQVPPIDNAAEATIEKGLPPGSILEYSADRRFRFIALLRSKGIAANGVELFDLALLDVEKGDFRLLIEEMPRIYQLSLSPDGQWFAYTTDEKTGRIYALRTDGIGKPIDIGSYIVDEDWEYGQILWAPDGRRLVWSDASGIWITNPDEPDLRQILTDVIEIKDLQGEISSVRVMYPSLTWSPSGRFILALVKPFQSTVKWQGIIDARRGQISEVPGTYEYQSPAANARLGQNGDLIVSTGFDPEESHFPSLGIFRIVPTRDDMVIPKEEFLFHPEQFVSITGDFNYNNEFFLDVPTQIDEWNYSFIINPAEKTKQSVLFLFDKKSGSLSVVSEIPIDTISIDWSPNGDASILQGQHGSVLLILADERQVIDIGAAWELDSCCVDWMPIDIGRKWKDQIFVIGN
jgi:WD40 repeat protein